MDARVECKLDNFIDLSANIAWTPIKMDGEEELHDKEQKVERVAKPPRTL